ncbi:hypothetical protein [Haloplanus sp.]|uniref:hypothetical protein n=1 Tax=Haloplanus sp. TaxID=1961696 RepID=UPI00262117F9|nr:hypothetical protein [Haloplanus sp.]
MAARRPAEEPGRGPRRPDPQYDTRRADGALLLGVLVCYATGVTVASAAATLLLRTGQGGT